MTQFSLEIFTVDPSSKNLAAQFKEIAPALAAAYVPVETDFARQNPKALQNDKFLNVLQPFFADGLEKVTWDVVEAKVHSLLSSFFADSFLKGLASNTEICQNNTHYLAIARDPKTKAPLAALYGWINKNGKEKNIRIPIFGVQPKAQGEGIGRALLSLLFQKIPNLQKIHLSTRISNQKALKAYHNWGFTLLPTTMENWVNLEYNASQSESLLLKQTAED